MAKRETVLAAYAKGLTDGNVLGFFNDHRPLSNFHVEPFICFNLVWQTSENAYQFAKLAPEAVTEDDKRHFTSCTPGKAKDDGQTLKLRPDWDAVKESLMRDILTAKFVQCPVARRVLVSTGKGHLEEVNWWGDRTWGTYEGVGKNLLGKILMDIRERVS